MQRQLHRKQIHAWQAVQKSVVVWWLIQQRPELVRGSPGSPVFSGESDELMEAGEDGGVGGCTVRGPERERERERVRDRDCDQEAASRASHSPVSHPGRS